MVMHSSVHGILRQQSITVPRRAGGGQLGRAPRPLHRVAQDEVLRADPHLLLGPGRRGTADGDAAASKCPTGKSLLDGEPFVPSQQEDKLEKLDLRNRSSIRASNHYHPLFRRATSHGTRRMDPGSGSLEQPGSMHPKSWQSRLTLQNDDLVP